MKFCANFLDKREIELLHEATLKVLSTAGVHFQSQRALDVFAAHGARVSGEIVYLDEKLIFQALASVPRSFEMQGSGGSVCIGGGSSVFASASGPVFVKRGTDKHLATTDDFINFMKLSQVSKALDVTNYIVVEPQDMPEEKRKLYQVASALQYSTKPLVGMTMGAGKTLLCLNLIRDFFGSLDEYRLMGIISPISPLTYDSQMIDHVIQYAQVKQPLLFAACSQPGATSPITLAGTLVVDNAQVLAGIVLSQLLSPGMPVVYGSTSTSCDLRFVAPAIGSPETALITATISQLSKFYGLPCRSGGSLTDSKLCDMQAGLESMMTLMPTLMTGVDFVLQSMGILESFNTLSYEKFIIDDHSIRLVKRLARGFEIDENHLGVETICDLGPGGQYLGEEHTAEHYRTEQYIPELFSREGYDKWERGGAFSLEQRASIEIEHWLNAYRQPAITATQQKLIDQYL